MDLSFFLITHYGISLREILNPVRTSCNPVKTLGSDFKERLDGISRSAIITV